MLLPLLADGSHNNFISFLVIYFSFHFFYSPWRWENYTHIVCEPFLSRSAEPKAKRILRWTLRWLPIDGETLFGSDDFFVLGSITINSADSQTHARSRTSFTDKTSMWTHFTKKRAVCLLCSNLNKFSTLFSHKARKKFLSLQFVSLGKIYICMMATPPSTKP